MNDTQEILFKNKELRNWWSAVIQDPKFREMLLYFRSAFMESNPNTDQIKGARAYETFLTTLSEAPDTAQEVPKSGINYMADRMPPKPVADKPVTPNARAS